MNIINLEESGAIKDSTLPITSASKSFILIEGQGSEITESKTLQNRAKRKLITQKIMLSLIDIAKDKEKFERVQAYWNTFHCQNRLISSDKRIYGRYCKNRFCTLCTANRKADIINRYYPTLKTWEEPYFLTLTVKSVRAPSLGKWIEGMQRAFSLILQRCKKRYQRGKGIELIGIRSMECNFNPEKKTYNPHFHIITKNKEMAEVLLREWMFQWKDKKRSNRILVTRKAQCIRKINGLENCLIEVIKYGSKIFTEPDISKKSKGLKSSVPPKVYAQALDNIFTAMKGKRIFERFGFNLPKVEKPQQTARLAKGFELWEYDISVNDWTNTKTGECLTNYRISAELSYLLEQGMDRVIG